jgi:hypothetical protein
VRLTLLPSNLSAAKSGFLVLSVTQNLARIRLKFGLSMNSIRLQYYAAVAGINCPSPNTSNVIRSARNAVAVSIPAALAIAIFTLNPSAMKDDFTFD